jgi:4-hydroxythreonine-4-phosphate dehydrogenase
LAWLRRAELDLPAFYLLADPAFVARRAQALGLNPAVAAVAPSQAKCAFSTALPVVDLGLAVTATPGAPDDSSAPAAIAAIERAAAAALAGEASAVVTNPIAKHVLYRAGFAEAGHTEFLGKLAARATDRDVMPVMMIWSPELAVVPVTIHVPLASVPSLLTRDLIFATGRIVARDLTRRFGIARPRLAVAGLNPHAGEGGVIGSEERDIIAPAIAAIAAEGVAVRGPLSADTLFHAAARATYDAVLCMYHDQALIPAKTLAFGHAVNVTLGLPFVRTSPDHGTAFDIAGTGRADPSSLVAALKLAARLAAAARPAAAAAE